MMTIHWHGRNNLVFGMIAVMTDVREKQQPQVFIYRPVDETGVSHRRLAAAGCRVQTANVGDDLESVLAAAGPVHALLAATIKGKGIDRALLESLPDLRIVAKYTIGVDDVDVAAATEAAVLVTHSPTEANWGGVAEGTLAMMLALLKKLEIRSAGVKAGGWRDDAMRGTYLGARGDGYAGITLGLVGFGRIGRRVAELMAPWKVKLLAADPYVDPVELQRRGAEPVELAELLSRSDVVSIHCALTAETRNLIGCEQLELMPPHAILINTARGSIVDIDAVCDALDAEALGGVALDVFPTEPPANDARILRFDDRVLLSPHMVAANHGGTLQAAIPWATDAVLAALRGEVPEHVYNKEAIDDWKARFATESLLDE